jgi:hypothetical protein
MQTISTLEIKMGYIGKRTTNPETWNDSFEPNNEKFSACLTISTDCDHKSAQNEEKQNTQVAII